MEDKWKKKICRQSKYKDTLGLRIGLKKQKMLKYGHTLTLHPDVLSHSKLNII